MTYLTNRWPLPSARLLLCTFVMISLMVSLASAAEAPRPSPHDVITAGCSVIGGGMLPSRVAATGDGLEPLCWASPVATGGDRLGLQGTLPVPGWAGYHGTGRVAVWTGHGGLFGAGGDGVADNDRFRQNMFNWLLNGGARLGFTGSHREWNTAAGLSPVIGEWLAGLGVGVTDIPGVLDAASLAGCDAVVIGNPWGEITDAEIEALDAWVSEGGGLLVLGLGWSWRQQAGSAADADYSVNRLGRRFGFEARTGTINDPQAPNGDAGKPAFAVAPLAEYTPATVNVLRSGEVDVDTVKQLAADHPGDLFVIEGEHMGLQLPTADWTELDSPAQALSALDALWEAELELTGGHPAFGGAMVWYIAKQDPEGKYWMHSGNPIVFKQAAARREIVPRFNSEGWPGWGFPHEMGHNMVISACGSLFVHSGTGEEWCNVFSIWTLERLGWPERTGAFDEGHAYHAQADPDFTALTDSSWVLLGCLELIWRRYGWEGMQAFFAQAAVDHAAGRKAGDDAARTAYFVEQLSHAYQVDFAELIAHWGFPVSDESQAITSVYPPADVQL